MSFNTIKGLHFWWRVTSSFFLLHHLLHHSSSTTTALNSDGIFLLSFKYLILNDPLSALETWNYYDQTPCLWKGITCSEIGPPGTLDMFRVTSLVLPNNQLLGSISPDLGRIEHLRHLDLSNNFFNGSLPSTIFNASELQVLSLSNNVISGQLTDSVSGLKSLQFLNLSDNAFAGKLPQNLTSLQNLTVISLKSNYFSGKVPGGFSKVQVLDLSSNLLNGSLPSDFGGESLRFLNVSYNKISGNIPLEFAKLIPVNATVDLSFNNLTGAIPESSSLLSQKKEFFSGNSNLCGKPLKNLCTIPSSLSKEPNVTTSSPAIAAIPKTIDSTPVTASNGAPPQQQQQQTGLKPGTIVGIVVGDLAGIALLAMVILYVYQSRKRKHLDSLTKSTSDHGNKTGYYSGKQDDPDTIKASTWSCLTIKGEETSEETSSDSDGDERNREPVSGTGPSRNGGLLVTVDDDQSPGLELETLLKASAYTLGANGESIVYKALMEDGTAVVVRRIGKSQGERMRDFESQVRSISKVRHPNLVRIRGFYWGDEKLVIYEYVSNGSLANTGSRRAGSSPCNQPLEIRLKIARGIARGLSYIHEKKHVHANIKPSNILLNNEMEPIISDFGLDRLILPPGTSTHKSGSARYFGSLKSASTATRDSQYDVTFGGSPGSSSLAAAGVSPYQAPESMKNLKPNPKWDVFSFGVVLLELLTGRVFSDRELGQWTGSGSMVEDKSRVLRLVDVGLRGEVEYKEEALLACLKLGFQCASFVPQKRPTMKEALQVLDKFTFISLEH
ncbi:probable LRR receptor-like serine/threonine-protein kinase At4g37250 [Cannabis sativa]|uniref:probable LRR receptor-like serine/threonine-protein kinase At4g37250 n=1 Tax=Cannabis sativa TaxID=3483 RepID=UPI0029CA6080|nr:probable LRR receptor-like serine/threonine-protein kinase At4g37250 [Cannabis sativa]